MTDKKEEAKLRMQRIRKEKKMKLKRRKKKDYANRENRELIPDVNIILNRELKHNLEKFKLIK
jgi:hypothetical protein